MFFLAMLPDLVCAHMHTKEDPVPATEVCACYVLCLRVVHLAKSSCYLRGGLVREDPQRLMLSVATRFFFILFFQFFFDTLHAPNRQHIQAQ